MELTTSRQKNPTSINIINFKVPTHATIFEATAEKEGILRHFEIRMTPDASSYRYSIQEGKGSNETRSNPGLLYKVSNTDSQQEIETAVIEALTTILN